MRRQGPPRAAREDLRVCSELADSVAWGFAEKAMFWGAATGDSNLVSALIIALTDVSPQVQNVIRVGGECVSRADYTTCYRTSYGVTFPVVFLAHLIPEEFHWLRESLTAPAPRAFTCAAFSCHKNAYTGTSHLWTTQYRYKNVSDTGKAEGAASNQR